MRDLAGRCSRRRSLHTPTTPNTTQPLPLLPLPPPPPPHPYAHHQIKITNSNLAGCRPDKGREKGEAGPTVQLTTTLCGAQSGTGRVLDSTPGLRLPTPASIVDHIVAVGHVQNTVRSQLSWLWLRILVLRQYEGRWRRHPPHMQLFRLRVSVSVRSTVLHCKWNDNTPEGCRACPVLTTQYRARLPYILRTLSPAQHRCDSSTTIEKESSVTSIRVATRKEASHGHKSYNRSSWLRRRQNGDDDGKNRIAQSHNLIPENSISK